MNPQQLLFFNNPENRDILSKPVNITNIPQRSPFRYPGGKTWLVPTIRQWLKQDNKKSGLLIEPFAGGGIVSLTAAFENLAEEIIMSEIDPEIAVVWQTILSDNNDWLANKIHTFKLTPENVRQELLINENDVKQKAFSTILKNRVLHGGIMAKGAGFIKTGENSKGIASRWYPETLKNRIQNIKTISHKITFFQVDAFEIIQQNLLNEQAFFFIDPPYTIAGKRLYSYHEIDHERLFSLTSQIAGRFMLTYDDSSYIRDLAEKYKLSYKIIPMKTTHHLQKNEIILSDNFNWH